MRKQMSLLVFYYVLVLALLLFTFPYMDVWSIPSVILGLISWFFSEYVANRFIIHKEDFPKKLERYLTANHFIHHKYPKRKKGLRLPFLFTFAISIPLSLVFIALNGVDNIFWFYLGLVIGGFWFEFCHYAAHHLDINLRYFKNNKIRHEMHHGDYPDKFFGITNGVFDSAFGTSAEIKESDSKKASEK